MRNSYDRWVFLPNDVTPQAGSYPIVQVLTLSGTANANTFKLSYGGSEDSTVYTKASNQTSGAIQAGLRTLTGDGSLSVAGSTDAGPFTITFVTLTNPYLVSLTSATGGVSGVVTTTTTQPKRSVANMEAINAVTSLTDVLIFGQATGGSEFAWVMNLPAGFTIKNVTLYATTAAGAATTHGWLTVATFDGVNSLKYQAATADTTSGTVPLGPKNFQPVVSANVPFVTPYEGQYVFTMTQVTGSATTAYFAGAAFLNATLAARQFATSVPQNVNGYGNAVTTTLVNPWAAAIGLGSQTTPPAVGTSAKLSSATGTGYIPSKYVPYCEVSSS